MRCAKCDMSTSTPVPTRIGSPLPESKLGTKAHWDEVYAREAANFRDYGDEGEVWFGDEAVERLVGWFERAADPDSDDDEEDGEEALARGAPLPLSPDQLSILDLGTGNGNVLFGLVQAETSPAPTPARMMGVDYCEDSVVLARAVAEARGEREKQVRFGTVDVLDAASVARLRQTAATLPPACEAQASQAGWNVVLDKGTYDAIALSSQPGDDGLTPVERYEHLVPTLLSDEGLLVLCSCNFTSAELKERFTSPHAGLQCVTVVPAPTFSFGGQSGSTTSTVVLRKPRVK